jgi:predicted RecA/RadA family phage recombinase
MQHGNITVFSISDPSGTHAPSAGPNGVLGELALNSNVLALANIIASISGASISGAGASGFSGFSGSNGVSGTSGFSGFSGISGFSGFSGATGVSGFSGSNGVSGTSGFSGFSGISGFSGFSGTNGVSGTSGFSGSNGVSGTSGFSGFSGISGFSGFSGATGMSGVSGFSGSMPAVASSWVLRNQSENSGWQSVCYGNGLFVAVANTGAGNRVMTSPDGINWTSRIAASSNQWQSVCYGNGLFVAVANSGTNRVMTSPDGITWTSRTESVSNDWKSVCYGNGLFVAVSPDGTGDNVMTSSDGINWTTRSSASDNDWQSVCYGNGLFVAVANSGTGDRVMSSPDGINWTSRTSANDYGWNAVCYGNGLFVAVGSGGSTDNIMTSPDGINWTTRTHSTSITFYGIGYGKGTFVSASYYGGSNGIITSTDGITWTNVAAPASNSWFGVCYGNEMFVIVSPENANRVMTSGATEITEPQNFWNFDSSSVGISGSSGYSGISGFSGYSGISGFSGFSGATGPAGSGGISGGTDGAVAVWVGTTGLTGSQKISETATTVEIVADETNLEGVLTATTNIGYTELVSTTDVTNQTYLSYDHSDGTFVINNEILSNYPLFQINDNTQSETGAEEVLKVYSNAGKALYVAANNDIPATEYVAWFNSINGYATPIKASIGNGAGNAPIVTLIDQRNIPSYSIDATGAGKSRFNGLELNPQVGSASTSGSSTTLWIDVSTGNLMKGNINLQAGGSSGFSGFSGYSGTNGVSGTSGFSGYSGTNGVSGTSGFSGFSGFSGAPGASGGGFSGVIADNLFVIYDSDTSPYADASKIVFESEPIVGGSPGPILKITNYQPWDNAEIRTPAFLGSQTGGSPVTFALLEISNIFTSQNNFSGSTESTNHLTGTVQLTNGGLGARGSINSGTAIGVCAPSTSGISGAPKFVLKAYGGGSYPERAEFGYIDVGHSGVYGITGNNAFLNTKIGAGIGFSTNNNVRGMVTSGGNWLFGSTNKTSDDKVQITGGVSISGAFSVFYNNPPNSTFMTVGDKRFGESDAKILELGYALDSNFGYIQATETGVDYRSIHINPNGGRVVLGNSDNGVDKLQVRDGDTNFGLGILKNYRGDVLVETGSPLSIDETYSGKIIVLQYAGNVVLNIADNVPQGFNCLLVQDTGVTDVTVAAAGGATIINRQSHTKLAGTYATASLCAISNSGGSNAVILFAGDTAP